MLEKQFTDVSRLALIRQWSMAGAPGDLDGHFGTPPDIHALVAERHEEPGAEAPPEPGPAPLLMKPAGEDDWQILVSDAA